MITFNYGKNITYSIQTSLKERVCLALALHINNSAIQLSKQ